MTFELVTIRTFSRPLDAQIARGRLEAEDIPAFVADEQVATIGPLLLDALGGVRLQVSEANVERALAILEAPTDDLVEEESFDDEVCCPRCNSAYWNREWSGLQLVIGILFAGAPLRFMSKRARCKKCEHVWDAPHEEVRMQPSSGPYRWHRRSLAREGRPVFRLRRTHAGAGAFFGILVGVIAAAAMAHASGLVILLAAPMAGWLFGRALGGDVCSDPTCRAPLRMRENNCGRCGGAVQWCIDHPADHFAARAEWQRAVEPKVPLLTEPKES